MVENIFTFYSIGGENQILFDFIFNFTAFTYKENHILFDFSFNFTAFTYKDQ